MKPAVLVTMQLPPAAMSRLEQHAAVTTVLDQSDPRFAAALAGTEGMFINPRTRIDRELLARAPKLRAVSTYSVGLDHIDLAAAEQRGVAVGHTPVLTDAVADLVIGLILALARRLPEALRIGASANWQTIPMGVDLQGKTLFIVGFGRIGRRWRAARSRAR